MDDETQQDQQQESPEQLELKNQLYEMIEKFHPDFNRKNHTLENTGAVFVESISAFPEAARDFIDIYQNLNFFPRIYDMPAKSIPRIIFKSISIIMAMRRKTYSDLAFEKHSPTHLQMDLEFIEFFLLSLNEQEEMRSLNQTAVVEVAKNMKLTKKEIEILAMVKDAQAKQEVKLANEREAEYRSK